MNLIYITQHIQLWWFIYPILYNISLYIQPQQAESKMNLMDIFLISVLLALTVTLEINFDSIFLLSMTHTVWLILYDSYSMSHSLLSTGDRLFRLIKNSRFEELDKGAKIDFLKIYNFS